MDDIEIACRESGSFQFYRSSFSHSAFHDVKVFASNCVTLKHDLFFSHSSWKWAMRPDCFQSSSSSFSSSSSRVDCAHPLIRLIPSSRTRLTFRRTQDLLITSMVEWNCSDLPPLFSNRWLIFRCPSICTDEVLLDERIEVRENDLFIPSQTLSVGFYKLILRVTRNDNPRVRFSSSSVFLEIVSVSVWVQLVSPSRWNIIHASEKDLVLDPGRYSLISDTKIFNHVVSSFFLSSVLDLIRSVAD